MSRVIVALLLCTVSSILLAEDPLQEAIAQTVKIDGLSSTGSIAGFEAGILISASGDVLTVYSPLLDAKSLRVTLADGRQFPAKVLAVDRKRNLAVLKTSAIDAPYVDLNQGDVIPSVGDVVLGLTNRHDIALTEKPIQPERAMVLAIESSANNAGKQTDSANDLIVLEGITHRAGAIGGALVDEKGTLLGLLAHERNGKAPPTPVRVAIPTNVLRMSVAEIMAGKTGVPVWRDVDEETNRPSLTQVNLRGITLLPNVLDRTPTYVDAVEPGSPAEQAGLMPDDLLLYVGSIVITSTDELRAAFAAIKPDQPIPVVLLRGENLLAVEIPPVSGK